MGTIQRETQEKFLGSDPPNRCSIQDVAIVPRLSLPGHNLQGMGIKGQWGYEQTLSTFFRVIPGFIPNRSPLGTIYLVKQTAFDQNVNDSGNAFICAIIRGFYQSNFSPRRAR